MAMKQNNFYLRWQASAKAGKSVQRRKTLLWAVPAVAIVAVCLLVWLALMLQTNMLRTRTQAIDDWCNAPENAQPAAQSLMDQAAAEANRTRINYIQGVTSLLDSYPDVTSTLLSRITAAGNSSISVVFRSYNAASGELQFDAVSSEVIDIPSYIQSLQNCGVFSTVTYTGYRSDNDGYTINLRCVLAAPGEGAQ